MDRSGQLSQNLIQNFSKKSNIFFQSWHEENPKLGINLVVTSTQYLSLTIYSASETTTVRSLCEYG
jgi:hypothetical protein